MQLKNLFISKKKAAEAALLANLADQATNPPGGDAVMGAYYQAMLSLLQEEKEFGKFFSSILAKRKMPPAHFTNLLYRGIQYIELYIEANDSYPEADLYKTHEGWRWRVKDLHAKHSSVLENILLLNDTTTTIFQRYMGDKIILNSFFKDRELLVADFGCGGNHGLPGLATNLAFNEFEDKTPQKTATRISALPIKIKEGVGIDRLDPEESTKWREACSFYPQELKGRRGIEELRKFEKKIKGVNKIKFHKADLLELDIALEPKKLPIRHFDAILMNTVLYQMTNKERERVIDTAKKYLKDSGIIIIQDFAQKSRKNPKALNFDVSWFRKSGMYGTFILSQQTNWEIKHIFKWGNGRCLSVEKGPDFNFLPEL